MANLRPIANSLELETIYVYHDAYLEVFALEHHFLKTNGYWELGSVATGMQHNASIVYTDSNPSLTQVSTISVELQIGGPKIVRGAVIAPMEGGIGRELKSAKSDPRLKGKLLWSNPDHLDYAAIFKEYEWKPGSSSSHESSTASTTSGSVTTTMDTTIDTDVYDGLISPAWAYGASDEPIFRGYFDRSPLSGNVLSITDNEYQSIMDQLVQATDFLPETIEFRKWFVTRHHLHALKRTEIDKEVLSRDSTPQLPEKCYDTFDCTCSISTTPIVDLYTLSHVYHPYVTTHT